MNITAANYHASAKLEIDGKEAPKNLMNDILQIVVEESLHLPGMFTLVIQNEYASSREQDKPWRYQDLLQIGKTIKIGFISSTTESKSFSEVHQGNILEGEITAIEAHFNESTQA
ncbi:MAG: type IV secretion protein Rhs, partial [Phormidesmis sp. CAN_BIN44]|nr:type IV secretion protein Rhs [Phormidesmis sp. CAN_BIN44]